MSSSVRTRRVYSRTSADSPAPMIPAEDTVSPVVLLVASLSVAVVMLAFLVVVVAIPVNWWSSHRLSPVVLPMVLILVIMLFFALLSFWILPDDRLRLLVGLIYDFGRAVRDLLVELAFGMYTLLKELTGNSFQYGLGSPCSHHALNVGLAGMLVRVGRTFYAAIQELWTVFTVKNLSMTVFLAIAFTYLPNVPKQSLSERHGNFR